MCLCALCLFPNNLFQIVEWNAVRIVWAW
jgi:hypothetical protein